MLSVILGWKGFLFNESVLDGLEYQNSDFGVPHFFDFVHWTLEIDTLDGLVDDAVPNGENGLIGVGYFEPSKEILCARLHFFQRFDVVWPVFRVFGERRNELAGEVAPVSLSDKRSGDDSFLRRLVRTLM